VQVARGCSSPAAPERHHIFRWRGGQCEDVRAAIKEALVIRNHGRHLGLLQHDLGEPHAIGIARVLPGQLVAAVLFLPGDDLRRKGGIFILRARTSSPGAAFLRRDSTMPFISGSSRSKGERWPCLIWRIGAAQMRQASPVRL
jgi:hypothetical protein